jgi:hypothetical protein
MAAESAKGFTPPEASPEKTLSEEEALEIKIKGNFRFDIASFFIKKQREIQKKLVQLKEENPEEKNPELKLDAEEQKIFKLQPESESTLFNLKNFLKTKKVDVGNNTLRLIEENGFPFVVLDYGSTEPLEMGLMEFLRNLDNTKGFSNDEAYTLFQKIIKENLHPEV